MKFVVLSLLLVPFSVAHSADHLDDLKDRIKALEKKVKTLEQPVKPEVTTEDMCLVGMSECAVSISGNSEKYYFQYSVRSSKAYIYGPNKEIIRAKSTELKQEEVGNWQEDSAQGMCEKHVARIRATIPDCD